MRSVEYCRVVLPVLLAAAVCASCKDPTAAGRPLHISGIVQSEGDRSAVAGATIQLTCGSLFCGVGSVFASTTTDSAGRFEIVLEHMTGYGNTPNCSALDLDVLADGFLPGGVSDLDDYGVGFVCETGRVSLRVLLRRCEATEPCALRDRNRYIIGVPETSVDRVSHSDAHGMQARLGVGSSLSLYLVERSWSEEDFTYMRDTVRSVVWTVSDTAVAQITGTATGIGVLHAHSPGATVVFANAIRYPIYACTVYSPTSYSCSTVSHIRVVPDTSNLLRSSTDGGRRAASVPGP